MATHNKELLTAREINSARLLAKYGKLTTKDLMELTSRCRGDVNHIMKALTRKCYVTFKLESNCSVALLHNSYYVWGLAIPFEDIMKIELRHFIDKAFDGDTTQFQSIANTL